ncbi:uncharacterized [Tachysurus ichikawai]
MDNPRGSRENVNSHLRDEWSVGRNGLDGLSARPSCCEVRRTYRDSSHRCVNFGPGSVWIQNRKCAELSVTAVMTHFIGAASERR